MYLYMYVFLRSGYNGYNMHMCVWVCMCVFKPTNITCFQIMDIYMEALQNQYVPAT